MEEKEIRETVRNLMKLLVVGIGFYVLFWNYPLWMVGKMQKKVEIGPEGRVKNGVILGENVTRQIKERVYFYTKAEGFDGLQLQFETLGEQRMWIGIRDRKNYHFLNERVVTDEGVDGWVIGKVNFDLRTAYFRNGEVQLMIYAPGVSESQPLVIKGMKVRLIKNSIINR